MIEHNSKPPPEEVERQLALPALTISSQLAKSFLAEGFQHCHRSGLTTGNAPRNFELVPGVPPLFGRESNCPYHSHKTKDFVQRRFSLRVFRWRDRLRMRPPLSGKLFALPATAAYMGVPEMPQQTTPYAFGRGQAGYRQMQPMSYSSTSPLISYQGTASGTAASTLAIQEQFPASFDEAQPSIGQSCSQVEVQSYAPERTPPDIGVHENYSPQRSHFECHVARIANGSSTLPHIVRTRGVRSIHVSAPADGEVKRPLQERAKSIKETNCVRLTYPADSPPREPRMRENTTEKVLSSPYSGSPERGSQHGAWPCPSSWVTVHSNDTGTSRGHQPISPAQVSPPHPTSSASVPPTREKRDLPASATSGELIPKRSAGDLVHH